MNTHSALPTARDKLLFTPGPLTTSLSVKQAMLRDAGSWHFEFNAQVARLREQLLHVAGLPAGEEWVAVLMQGSGSFGVESAVTSSVPEEGGLLVLTNGAYGDRIVQMAVTARVPHEVLRFQEHEAVDPAAVDAALANRPDLTHVALVHCETTTGLLNPLSEVGRVVRARQRVFIVDAMSSFGALPIEFEEVGIDFLISSANKCLEGVPGFSFVLCRRERLRECQGRARSHSLDLYGQWHGFEKNGQFRFTPPTHALLAFLQALEEFEQEGGVSARGARYAANAKALMDGMQALGFRPFLAPHLRSPIITTFHQPADRRFAFDAFYRGLSDRGFIIYPGKLTAVDTFRVGSIGRVFPNDLEQLVYAAGETLRYLGLPVPLPETTDG